VHISGGSGGGDGLSLVMIVHANHLFQWLTIVLFALRGRCGRGKHAFAHSRGAHHDCDRDRERTIEREKSASTLDVNYRLINRPGAIPILFRGDFTLSRD